jgi:hypothetical protein
MLYGMGRARMSNQGGRGFGFRGTTPPWPYIGLGRGGLPRCGYQFNRGFGLFPATGAPPVSGNTGPTGMSGNLEYMKYQAEVLRKQLEQVEASIRDLEAD